MDNKAQATLFVILALVLIVLVVLFFLLKNKLFLNSSKVISLEVQTYVQDCLDKNINDVIYLVGQGGGHYKPPEISTENGVAYFWYNGENLFPNLNKVSSELSQGVEEKLIECIGNFSNFKEVKISNFNPEVSSKIQEDIISFSVKYPIKIVKGEEVILLEDFSTQIESKFGYIYLIAREMVSEEPDKEGICLSCIYDYSLVNGLKIDMLNYGKDTTIFILSDENYEINNKPFEFIFANDYSKKI